MKISKLGLWWDPFFQSWKCTSLKFTEELCVMAIKNDTKIEEELSCRFKIDLRNLMIFDPSTWKNFQKTKNLKIFHFNVLFLSKLYIVWTKNVQRSYLSWQWRGIQNLERNRLVVSKLAWGIWWILTWALESLKNFHFNALLLSKVYIIWAKKLQRSYLSWHWRVMQNLKKNWLVVSKMTREIWQIFTRSLESVKIGTLMGSFCPK